MPRPFAEHEDIAACRGLLRGGSRSFFAASLLLPRRIRAPATALYAFCRVADDAVDLGADPRAAVGQLQVRLAAAYAGRPEHNPIDRAFAATVAAYAIPHDLPAALIEGLGWDAAQRRYENFAELLDYAARVAGTVGVMMALLMGVRDTASLACAADLGLAMQLTNIARDVGEDARAGRLFLPQDWLAGANIDSGTFLARPSFSPALGGVIQHLLAEADALYASGAAGIARLPWDCRLGIAAAARIYAAIGQNIAAAGYDSITRRARVSGRAKLGLALRASADVLRPAREDHPVILPANAVLLNAVPPIPALPKEPGGYVKILELFETLERRQRGAAGRRGIPA